MGENSKEARSARTEKFKRSELLSEDGWLSPSGIYYKCEPDEHDGLALFCAKKRGFTEEKLMEEGITPRHALQELGYVQMSQGKPFLSQKNLTRMQVEMFNKSGVQIPAKESKLTDMTKSEFFEKVESDLIKEAEAAGIAYSKLLDKIIKYSLEK